MTTSIRDREAVLGNLSFADTEALRQDPTYVSLSQRYERQKYGTVASLVGSVLVSSGIAELVTDDQLLAIGSSFLVGIAVAKAYEHIKEIPAWMQLRDYLVEQGYVRLKPTKEYARSLDDAVADEPEAVRNPSGNRHA